MPKNTCALVQSLSPLADIHLLAYTAPAGKTAEPFIGGHSAQPSSQQASLLLRKLHTLRLVPHVRAQRGWFSACIRRRMAARLGLLLPALAFTA